MIAHQAPPSLGFSGQEHWSGLPFKSESEVTQSCLTLSDPMDSSLPGSSIHGIFQATVLDWVSIAFSRHCPWKSLFIISFFRAPTTPNPTRGCLKPVYSLTDLEAGNQGVGRAVLLPKALKEFVFVSFQCQVAPGNPHIMRLNLNLCFLTRPFLVHLKHPSSFSHQDTGQQI